MRLENLPTEPSPTTIESSRMTIPESASDFNQWLQSMLAVARLPGGLPTEFRRKLWLSLAERYLKRRGVKWEDEKVKWLSEKTRADDEELGIQIVKDLHRTGHSLLSGASGQHYQAKLKKILMGYTRWNPEVGYCQGFNMLGAIILQVMEKSEVDSIKVMIFLIEGLLPNGYFCGALMGLQADMAVFRELLGHKLPKLARHLQKLQHSTNEPSFEPPIINVFTMQWFLTLFCNCLPMNYVLRIWDLIMLEGSDILLRTALSIWKLLEDRILREVKTADDFYCKMETLSAELLSGTLIDSNRLIHMISTLGAINNLQELRQKHLQASYSDQKKLNSRMLYSSAECDEGRIAVANAWASRRGSQPTVVRGQSDREKIALDITILKKQYDKLRERQKQAHIILSSAVSKQNQHQSNAAGPSRVNNLLVGKNAIISKGRKGPPKGSIPPARNQKLSKTIKGPVRQLKIDETIQWNNTDEAKKRRNSVTWKELNAERRLEDAKVLSKSSSASSLGSSSKGELSSPKKRSDSSSYSEDSDGESSPSTSLCDDEINSSLEASPMKKKRYKDLPLDVLKKPLSMITIEESSPTANDTKDCPEISISCGNDSDGDADADNKANSPIANFYLDLPSELGGGDITSISQLSPMPDISSYFTAISPIQTPCDFFEFPDFSSFILNSDPKYQVNDEGVTNEFFERVFEANLTSDTLPLTPDNTNSIMSKSFSPSVMKTCDEKVTNEMTEECLSKCIKQKSLSMDEQTCDKEVVVINRSFSDSTVNVENDGLKKIIAENSKILNKLIPRPDIPIVEAAFSKLNIEPIIVEEPKSPNNLSDVEEEIAAIDNCVDDIDETLLSDIQDLANVESFSECKNKSSFTCNNTSTEENVTERKEKSINSNLATLACSSMESKLMPDVDDETLEIKSLTVREIQSNDESRKEGKSESPKFNEIQLMVTKLKEEMEIQLKKSAEVDIEKEIENNKKINSVDEVKIKKQNSIEVKLSKAPEIIVSDTSKLKVDSVHVVNDEKLLVDEKSEKHSQENSSTVNETDDLENSVQRKIDTNDSDVILAKLNTQLEKCQKVKTKEIVSSDNDKILRSNSKMEASMTDVKQQSKVKVENKYDNENKVPNDVCDDKNVNSEMSKIDGKKDSNEILEKLNMQLQRCEKTGLKSDVLGTSFTLSKDKIFEKSAVMELATMIKERELEKLSEQKNVMKTSKDVDFDLNLSPLRTSRPKSNIGSPESINGVGKFNNYFYDHEPRSDTRRRDIATLETEQIRRPFKSSPSSSLSASPSNISNTLSSIQNTIKILDSACSKTDAVKYKKIDRTMELTTTDKDWKTHKNKYDSSTSFKSDDITYDINQSKRQQLIADDDRSYDKSYDLSPRRKRYEFDVDEVNYKTSSIDSSPSRFASKNYSRDVLVSPTRFTATRSLSREASPSRFTSRTQEIDPDYVSKLRYLSTEDYIAGRKSPLSGSREGLDVKFRIDRSPTSPMLSTSTHFSRPPRSPSHNNSSLLRFPSTDTRSSKSAENSPSRYSTERVESSSKYNSIDSKAESMSNLSCKPNMKYQYEWEKSANNRKYDFN
ncbi:CLUMA_CG005420, isoform A [Clunio marinus]|uniref:CLUMA_CG005420, isoform A n=1 Tax=Clunio marinus TaxID=568069 RepID=A0A1J1HUW0_9DIPT|nr:CLUMA_CG005420, isoform A [Clunio marinus]